MPSVESRLKVRIDKAGAMRVIGKESWPSAEAEECWRRGSGARRQ